MQWDLGLQGVGLLVAMSLGFGVLAQLIAGRANDAVALADRLGRVVRRRPGDQ